MVNFALILELPNLLVEELNKWLKSLKIFPIVNVKSHKFPINFPGATLWINVQKKLYGKAVIGVSAKLGLLVKTAMFEEIETELQEFATFMTQVKFLFYIKFKIQNT